VFTLRQTLPKCERLVPRSIANVLYQRFDQPILLSLELGLIIHRSMAARGDFIRFAEMTQLVDVICLVKKIKILVAIRFATETKMFHNLACTAKTSNFLLKAHISGTYNLERFECWLVAIRW
jgi:hypothetical protein